MRDKGLPQVLSWRWAPCAALVLGSLSFVGFALLTIPDHIGHAPGETSTEGLRYGAALARTQGAAVGNAWSSDGTSTIAAAPSPASQAPTRTTEVSSFPKRGFSPPLERPEPAPAAPSPVVPQQPQLLNVPPPEPAPATALPAPPPPQPEAAPPAPAPDAATPVPLPVQQPFSN